MKLLAAANTDIEEVLLCARVELQSLDCRRARECDVWARADAGVENCGPQRHRWGRIGVGPIGCGIPIAGEAQPSRILRLSGY